MAPAISVQEEGPGSLTGAGLPADLARAAGCPLSCGRGPRQPSCNRIRSLVSVDVRNGGGIEQGCN